MDEFTEMVRLMREKQKLYFKLRQQGSQDAWVVLGDAKKLEDAVDRLLEGMEQPTLL